MKSRTKIAQPAAAKPSHRSARAGAPLNSLGGIPLYFRLQVVAKAAGFCSRTMHRRMLDAGWPRRWHGNTLEVIPPVGLRAKCLAIYQRTKSPGLKQFSIAPGPRAEIYRTQQRYAALLALDNMVASGVPFERALVAVARDFTFTVSPRSLRLWQDRFAHQGLAGLLENKRGNSGRKTAH